MHLLKKIKKAIFYLLYFVFSSLLLLEIVLRVMFFVGFIPRSAVVIDYNLEDISFDGKVIPDAKGKGSRIEYYQQTKTVNSYSGFMDDFDYQKDALRIFAIGSSYINGCCLKNEEKDKLWNVLAERLLEEKLKKRIQISDISWNMDYRLYNYITVYGSKIYKKNVKHDYVLLEVCLTNFISDTDYLTLPDGKIKRNIIYEKDISKKGIIREIKHFLENFYSVKFIRLQLVIARRLGLISNTKAKLKNWWQGKEGTHGRGLYFAKYEAPHEVRKRLELKGIISSNQEDERLLRNLTDDQYVYLMYMSDRPSFDIKQVQAVTQEEIKHAYKYSNIKMKGRIEEGMKDMRELNELISKSGAKLIVMIFPEFTWNDLLVLHNELNKLGIDYIYLDDLRKYSELWALSFHHPSVKAQKLWAESLAEQLPKIIIKQ